MDRRTLLKIGTVGTAATALGGVANATGNVASSAAGNARKMTVRSPGTSGHAYGPALDKLVAYAKQDLLASGMPGMTFCVVDADGFAAMGALGWAELERRIPVNPSHLFQIGSISKSFAALCAYRLADEGKIDLGAPLSRYLPEAPLPAEPILIQQVLSHTAGLPRSSPLFPRVPDQQLWTGFTPGAHFSYSNTGYELIGMLVEKVHGKPYPLALRELLIEPLGITGMREVLQAGDAERYAMGYAPRDASGPNITHVPLGQAPWVNLDSAAGNIGATADAMTRYLQFLIAVGRGRGAPLFSDAAAKRFSTVLEPAAAAAAIFGKGTAYASGLGVVDLAGHAAFHHTGGTWGFSSAMTVDPVTGAGCFASVNGAIGGYRPTHISQYACRLLRHVREGGADPMRPDEISADHVDRAQDYAGTYIAPDGDRFQLVARSDRLVLAANGHEGRMQSLEEDKFMSDHSRFGSHFFNFERTAAAVKGAWFGAVFYGRDAPVPQPVVPARLAALQGTYFSSDPLSGWWHSVYAQGERLVIENVSIYRTQNILRNRGDYWQPEYAENPSERVRFEAVVGGVPQRLNVSGRDLWRFNKV